MKELYASGIDQIGLQRMVYGLSPLVTYLKSLDMDFAPFFVLAGLSPESMRDPNAIMTLKQELVVTKAVIDKLGDPALGLSIGPRYHLSTFGMLGMAMMSSENLHHALHTLSGFHGLCWTRLRWCQLLDNDTAILEGREVEPLEPCLNYMLERDFTALVVMCSEMLGRKLTLQEVCFSHSAPNHALEYEAIFECPVRFGAERNALVFSSDWLEAALPQANQAVFEVYNAQCHDLLGRLEGEHSFVKMVESMVLDGTGNYLTFEQLAARLNISPRTLRRRLEQEGTTFQELLAKVRSTLAKELLLTGKLSVEQVSERLGYSDAGSFYHAFKRWTGKPPSAFR